MKVCHKAGTLITLEFESEEIRLAVTTLDYLRHQCRNNQTRDVLTVLIGEIQQRERSKYVS